MFCLAAASVVHANDLVFGEGYITTCLEQASGSDSDPRQCAGKAAEICMDETDGGYSTFGMTGCLDRELQWWDGQLNAAYASLMAQSKEIDQEMSSGGYSAPSQEEALRGMQRAWIAFRDGACDFAAAQWTGGTGAGPARVGCLMHRTAEQAQHLKSMLHGG